MTPDAIGMFIFDIAIASLSMRIDQKEITSLLKSSRSRINNFTLFAGNSILIADWFTMIH